MYRCTIPQNLKHIALLLAFAHNNQQIICFTQQSTNLLIQIQKTMATTSNVDSKSLTDESGANFLSVSPTKASDVDAESINDLSENNNKTAKQPYNGPTLVTLTKTIAKQQDKTCKCC